MLCSLMLALNHKNEDLRLKNKQVSSFDLVKAQNNKEDSVKEGLALLIWIFNYKTAWLDQDLPQKT